MNARSYLLSEKPRANLYNVVRKIREPKVLCDCLPVQKAYKRLLYIAKIREADSRGDLESKISFKATGQLSSQRTLPRFSKTMPTSSRSLVCCLF